MTARPRAGPQPVARSVTSLRRMLGLPAVDPLEQIAADWAAIVGSRMADACHPVVVRDRVLVIAVDVAALAEQLAWMQAAVVERVNSACEASVVDAIRVRSQPR